MNLPLRIAIRYLFAKKSHNAINIVSGVSAAGVGVATAAMVCVLSVMNGFGSLVEQMFSTFDPELKIVPVEGKSFHTSTEAFEQIKASPAIAIWSETIEQTALIKYADKQIPAVIKGVDDNFEQLTQIDSILVEGTFSLCDWYDNGAAPTRAFERCVAGQGLASQLGIGAHFITGLKFYAPRRGGSVNLMRPDKSFNQEGAFISGIFAVKQAQYDDSYMLVSMPLARSLFGYQEDEVSAVELQVAPHYSVRKVKKELSAQLGTAYKVQDRYEQQADFFRILKIEKALTALLLVFILLVASFNIVGSLSMLMIDKQNDVLIFANLGATKQQIQRIFLYEGWLVSSLGAVIGLVIGVLICVAQEQFGWLKMGNGSDYIISAYPVEVQVLDLVMVLGVVLLIGFVAAWWPSRQVKIERDRV